MKKDELELTGQITSPYAVQYESGEPINFATCQGETLKKAYDELFDLMMKHKITKIDVALVPRTLEESK